MTTFPERGGACSKASKQARDAPRLVPWSQPLPSPPHLRGKGTTSSGCLLSTGRKRYHDLRIITLYAGERLYSPRGGKGTTPSHPNPYPQRRGKVPVPPNPESSPSTLSSPRRNKRLQTGEKGGEAHRCGMAHFMV